MRSRGDEAAFRFRVALAYALVVLAFGLLVARLLWLQWVQYEHFQVLAEGNRISLLPIQPARGRIVDRHGNTLAEDGVTYTLELDARGVDGMEATLAKLSTLLAVSERELRRFRRAWAQAKGLGQVLLKRGLSEEERARVAANGWRLPGVVLGARPYRHYPHGALLSHVLGYVGQPSADDLQRLARDGKSHNYRGADVLGKSGLELVYEEVLRGEIGAEEVESDARGRFVRTLQRHEPKAGRELALTLDLELQRKADELFGARRGALVALDPSNGEVLALLSKPGFDPTPFVEGIDSASWKALNEDGEKPLLNRALRGLYPPGSTLKPFIGLAALQTASIRMDEERPAPGYFTLPGSTHRFRDVKPSGHGRVNLRRAIGVSSDTFFYRLAWEMGIDRLAPTLADFGLGSRTGIDLRGELGGVLPSKDWKRKRFARQGEVYGRWYPADSVVVGIGQGFNSYTPLQMARATAILANGGRMVRPHLRKGLAGEVEQLPLAAEHVAYVQAAMVDAVSSGRLGQGLSYRMAGKTGTAQVVQIKQGARYDAAALQEIHRDHSWFIAFAPAEQPRIAVAAIVENAGFGAASAGPLVRALLDFHLGDKT